MLPDLKSQQGFDALRESGYGFSSFDRPQQHKMQAELVDLAVKTAGSLTTEPVVISDLAYLITDSLFRAPRGFEFFPRFPKEEVVQFTKLAVASRESNLPLPIACPACPDYRGHYRLFDGIDDTAERVLSNLAAMTDFFGKRNLGFFINMHIADVEAFEPLILQTSGETTASFLRKTAGSIAATQEKIYQLGLEGIIRCSSMLEAFGQAELDYFALKVANTREIIECGGKKVRKTVEALAVERVRLGDFDLVNQSNHKPMAAEELANYATYGDLVDGRAVILSPDTMSPMPAYNFLRGGEKLFNPTIYLKAVKSRNFSVFME